MLSTIAFSNCGGVQPRASSFPKNELFRGTIGVVILEKQLGNERKLSFEVRLNEGQILPVKQEDLGDDYEGPRFDVPPTSSGGIGNCYRSPRLASPDKKLLAYCEGPPLGISNGTTPDTVIVVDEKESEVLRMAIPLETRMVSFCWAPDSNSIAVLTASRHTGFGPLDILAALTGHPVPYMSFAIELFQMNGPKMHIPTFLENTRYGFGSLLNWSK